MHSQKNSAYNVWKIFLQIEESFKILDISQRITRIISSNLIFHLDSLHYPNKSIPCCAHFEDNPMKRDKIG